MGGKMGTGDFRKSPVPIYMVVEYCTIFSVGSVDNW